MSKNVFNSVKIKVPKRNVFDLSHDFKFTGKMGNLIPVMAMDCLPGDRVKLSCQSLVRFAPLVAPVMHRYTQTVHYFFVPNRLLWEGWEKWIVNAPDKGVHPYCEYDDTLYTKLMDYFGLPTPPAEAGVPLRFNPMMLSAYQFIYNEFYRDQNLSNVVDYALASGNNTARLATLADMKRRAWQHDYFTGALPFAQKGAAVDIPLGTIDGDAPVIGQIGAEYELGNGNPPASGNVRIAGGTIVDNNSEPIFPEFDLTAQTDGLGVTPTTINDLRRAFKLQEWLEKAARFGTRYIEAIKGFFGVDTGDARLQRPEYITGSKQAISISEVLNTTGEDGGLPQGNMAGHGISVGDGYGGSFYCREHGWIIGIMSVMPDTAYMQGLHKMYVRGTDDDPYEYMWSDFAHIGEQEVQGKEVFAQWDSIPDNSTFGYVPRYSEYRFLNSRVAGDFKTNLAYWTSARIFDPENPPVLNETFIECNPDDRIFAVTDPDVDNLYCHLYHKVFAKRPVPKYGTPGF